MTTLQALLAFILAATILTITPGVDTAMVLRAAAGSGPRGGALAGLGIALGCLLWGAAVSLGLASLLAAAPLAYTALTWAGAAYLVWMGTRQLLRPRHGLDLGEGGAATGTALFRQGLVTNLLNPKIGVFYISFLPQFIPTGSNVALFSFALAAVHVLISLIWFAVLIAATARIGRLLRRPGGIALMDRLTGLVFIGFGARLAFMR